MGAAPIAAGAGGVVSHHQAGEELRALVRDWMDRGESPRDMLVHLSAAFVSVAGGMGGELPEAIAIIRYAWNRVNADDEGTS